MPKPAMPNKTTPEQKPKNPWLEAGPFRYVPGYINGRHQPCMVVTVKPTPQLISALSPDNPTPASFLKWWNEQLYAPTPAETQTITDWPALANQLAAGTVQVLRYLGLPVLDDAQVSQPATNQTTQQWTTITLPIPHCDAGIILDAWQFMVLAASQAMHTKQMPQKLLQQQVENLKEQKRHTISSLLLKAAYDINLPVTPLKGMLTQFGHGRNSAWLEHTFTQNTASLSVRMARDKQATAIRLRQACLPVAPHHEVTNANEALNAARALGYPVVVKPLDLDGGVGVAANLTNDKEVQTAYAIAYKQSKRVLVEKHINGRDYRLTVMDGEMIWAVERIPAGVTGDGIHSIEQLIAQENLTEQRRPGIQQTLKPLEINSEARQLLNTQSLNAQSVPARNQFVYLRRTANVANGGRPKVVTEQVHPDNAQLAVLATQALRLDLAGIDLIIPDISRSWRETGGVICEVNAQPDLGSTTAAHLYPLVLQKRVNKDGRIPVIALLGSATEELTEQVVAALQMKGLKNIGWALAGSAGINTTTLSTSGTTFSHTMMLLTDPTVDALVFSIHDDELLKRGLPADRLDWLVLAGTNLKSSTSDPQLLQHLVSAVLPASKQIAMLKGLAPDINGLASAAGTQVLELTTEEFLEKCGDC